MSHYNFTDDNPPSTCITCPVIHFDSSPNKNVTIAAKFSGEPIACKGWRLAAASIFSIAHSIFAAKHHHFPHPQK